MCQAISSFVIIVVNLLIAIIGIALTTVGALLKWKKEFLIEKIIPKLIPGEKEEAKKELSQLIQDIANEYSSEAIAIFILGIVIFVISFLGCCGVIGKVSILLKLYAVVIILVVLALTVIIIVLATSKANSKKVLGEILSKYFKSYDKQTGSKILVNEIQKNLKCCGALDKSKEFLKGLPDTCCASSSPCTDASADLYKANCTDEIWKAFLPKYKQVLQGLGGVTGVFLLFTIMALYLSRKYNQQEMMQ